MFAKNLRKSDFRQLKILCLLSLALAVVAIKTYVELQISVIIIVAVLGIFFFFVFFLKYINTVRTRESDLALLRQALSDKFYTEVKFSPKISMWQLNPLCISLVKTLCKCLRIENKLNLKYFAKLENDNVNIVVKDSNNRIIDEYIINDLRFFINSYYFK